MFVLIAESFSRTVRLLSAEDVPNENVTMKLADQVKQDLAALNQDGLESKLESILSRLVEGITGI